MATSLSENMALMDSGGGVRSWQAPLLGDDELAAGEAPKEEEQAEEQEEEEEEALKPPTAEEIEEIQRQAWNEGYEDGRKAGLAAAEQEYAGRVEALDQVLREMARPLDELDDRVEEELVRLAMAVARQLVRREVRTDPGQIVGAIREAVALLPSANGDIRIELHPQDAALVRELLHLENGDEPAWRLLEDPTLSRGGCRVHNATSRIDATLESRINRVIAEVLGDERAGGAA